VHTHFPENSGHSIWNPQAYDAVVSMPRPHPAVTPRPYFIQRRCRALGLTSVSRHGTMCMLTTLGLTRSDLWRR
jgi:hypothetical protein